MAGYAATSAGRRIHRKSEHLGGKQQELAGTRSREERKPDVAREMPAAGVGHGSRSGYGRNYAAGNNRQEAAKK
jgi:hypothetical protein